MASPHDALAHGATFEKSSTTFSSTEDDVATVKQSADLEVSSTCLGEKPRIADESSPITYLYLTYETQLPTPSVNSIGSGESPPAPDLSRYESPFAWPASRKNTMVWLSSVATCLTAYTAGSYSPASGQMEAEWNVGEIAIAVGITTFCMGFAIAPMVLAPFSEINGRYPVFAASGVVYVVALIGCAATQSYAGMLVCRFLTGCGSSVFSTMVGGVISDMYHAKDRNTPMAIFSSFVLVGTGLGPLVSGFVTENISWRWVFWLQVITNGVMTLAIIIFFQETRGSILLSRKAQRLNRWYAEREGAGFFGVDWPIDGDEKCSQRVRWKVKSDEERESLHKMIRISLYRPFHLLFTEPVVFFFSLWVAFAWGVLYLTFSSITIVFSATYSFDTEQCGAVFAAISIGSIFITIISIHQERLLALVIASSASTDTSTKSSFSNSMLGRLDLNSPEARLYFPCLESILLPAGLFWFGWAASPSIPWIVPTLGIACASMGIYSVYLATFNYLADTYHRYASSALAAQSFCRNVLGGLFPLATNAMFTNLGYAQASSLLGAIGAVLTLVPWVLAAWGPQIRARSKFAREIM